MSDSSTCVICNSNNNDSLIKCSCSKQICPPCSYQCDECLEGFCDACTDQCDKCGSIFCLDCECLVIFPHGCAHCCSE